MALLHFSAWSPKKVIEYPTILFSLQLQTQSWNGIHRLVDSPAKNTLKRCQWTGSVAKTAEHMAKHKCAMLMLPDKPDEDSNKILFTKMVPNDRSYFLDELHTTFKPIMLLHSKLSRGQF